VNEDPLSWAEHRHRRGVRGTTAAGKTVMFGSLSVEPAGAVGVAESPMTFGESSVSIEEVEV